MRQSRHQSSWFPEVEDETSDRPDVFEETPSAAWILEVSLDSTAPWYSIQCAYLWLQPASPQIHAFNSGYPLDVRRIARAGENDRRSGGLSCEAQRCRQSLDDLKHPVPLFTASWTSTDTS